ncbi:MAG: hypothetical protein M5T61_20270 [Acidimicrobiia bacterium]|nr:hypothetical protein [Acidimicrobiia bacterium]
MTSELFGHVQEFPDPDSGDRFNALVGLDHVKRRLVDEAAVLLDPRCLDTWAKTHHDGPIAAVRAVGERVPLIVLAGDVGTGKTEVAETVGHPIAQRLKVDVTLYPLSLNAGSGLVGQMTTLITNALTGECATWRREARDEQRGAEPSADPPRRRSRFGSAVARTRPDASRGPSRSQR